MSGDGTASVEPGVRMREEESAGHAQTDTGDVRLTRRSILSGAIGGVAVAALHPFRVMARRRRSATPLVSNDAREQARTMAMHVHSSFSEGTGSMQAQLAEATSAGVDVLWWTDHDW